MRALTFRLAGDRGGIDALAVSEVARMVAIAPLAGAPRGVEGVIVVRGDTVPVLDLRARLGLPTREAAASDWLIVAHGGGRTVALRVDEVDDVIDVPDEQVRQAAGLVAAASTVAGVARLDDGLLVIHDAAHFLSATEADALEQALAARG